MTRKNHGSSALYLDEPIGSRLTPPHFYALSDFDKTDMDQLRVEFMRISPSYALVSANSSDLDGFAFDSFAEIYSRNIETIKQRSLNSARSGKLTKQNLSDLGKTFTKIQSTYLEYKHIDRFFFDWYADIGRHIFDNWTNRADVKFLGISNFEGVTNLNEAGVRSEANKYIDMITSTPEWPKTILMAVPLDLPKKIAIDHASLLIEAHYDWIVKVQDAEYRKRKKLATKRERPDALVKKLKLLICKAFYPDLPLWKVGELAGFSNSYRDKKLDQRKTKFDVTLMKSQLASLTNRALRTAQYIAEHASTDQFPVQDKVLTPYYDWDAVRARIVKAHPLLKV